MIPNFWCSLEVAARIGYHNKEIFRLVYTYAQYDRELLEPRHRHRSICKSNLLKWEHWPLTESAWYAWATTTKLMRFYSICFTKCFRIKSESASETKMFLVRKHLRNESVFETKVNFLCFCNEKILICKQS